jgi:hypothetical protein
MSDDPICPLCERPIPPHAKQSLHHLIPRLRGGKGGPTVVMHQICHNEIHATMSEAELARNYNSVEALRAHPRLALSSRGSPNAPRISIRRPRRAARVETALGPRA